MSDTWDDLAAEWDNADTQLYAERAFRLWSQKVAILIANLPENRVLDFGCGTGLLTEKIAPLCGHIIAVDTSAEMIGVLQRKVVKQKIGNVMPLATTVVHEMTCNHPALLEGFDLIVASSVCSFVEDYDTTVRDLCALLNSGGILAQWDWEDEMPAERIRKAYELAGLDCVSSQTAFEMTLNGETRSVVLGIARRL